MRGNLVRRLLAICSVTLTVLAAFAAARLNRAAIVSAAGGPSNLVLFDVQSTGGCPLGPAYTFCDQVPGTRGPAEVFFVNNSAAVTGLAVSLQVVPGLAADFAPGDFTITSNSCTGSLAANLQCEIGVAFSPTVAGSRSAVLTVTDAGGDTLAVNIAGTSKNLAISPPGDSCPLPDNAYMFCAEPVGGTTAPSAFTLTAGALATGVNLSFQAIPGLSSEFGAGDFTIASTTCTGSLAASTSCAVNVEFTPKTAGLRSAALTATDADGDETVIYLAGNTNSGLFFDSIEPGSNPAACARVNFFGYCNQPTSGSTPSTAFTLTNTSGTQVTGLTISPPLNTTQPAPPPTNFSVTGTSCATTLAANASCTINVAFTPLATGLQQGSVVVTDTAGDIAAINLSGTGDDFNMQIAAGQSQEVTVSQGNTATFMAALTADGVFGQNGETVSLACPTNLPEFTTCAFMPCPITPTVGGSVPFEILIATSTATDLTPPVPNPCNSPAASAAPGARGPNGVLRIVTNTQEPAPQFPALLAILATIALVLATIGFDGMGELSLTSVTRARRARVALVLVMLLGATLPSCGKKGNATTSTATPIATTMMNVVASATDSSGNTINASRGLQIILDVIKQQVTLP
jgi:hypothetical protein